jgi:hypothetical protein
MFRDQADKLLAIVRVTAWARPEVFSGSADAAGRARAAAGAKGNTAFAGRGDVNAAVAAAWTAAAGGTGE